MNTIHERTCKRSLVRTIALLAVLAGIASGLSGCCWGWGYGGGCGWHGGGCWHGGGFHCH
jgi:hypothetical protein